MGTYYLETDEYKLGFDYLIERCKIIESQSGRVETS